MSRTVNDGRSVDVYSICVQSSGAKTRHLYEHAQPKATYFPASSPLQAEANERLRLYLETSPRGERDVTAQLDAMEKARGTWLREVLDACAE